LFSQVALHDTIMVFAFAPIVELLLSLSSITAPWDTRITSVVPCVVIPVMSAQLWRKALLSRGLACRRNSPCSRAAWRPAWSTVTVNAMTAPPNSPNASTRGPSEPGVVGVPAPAGAFSCVSAAWQAHEAELQGYLRRRLADADAADDVLQDVFVKAMRHGKGFCALDNPRAWLFQVARNALVDRARASHPLERLPDGDDEPAAPQDDAPPAVDALASCLARTMAELSADDAAILTACDLAGQTQRDFAQAHGLSLPAAKSRLLRARQRLRDRLTSACQVRFESDGTVAGHVPRSPSV
jgi:RNA polymerase sigma-70 factor (ECF subfamily)